MILIWDVSCIVYDYAKYDLIYAIIRLMQGLVFLLQTMPVNNA